jgi:hypothetical protein
MESRGSGGGGSSGRPFPYPAATSAVIWQMCGLRGRTCLGKAGGNSRKSVFPSLYLSILIQVSYFVEFFGRALFCLRKLYPKLC